METLKKKWKENKELYLIVVVPVAILVVVMVTAGIYGLTHPQPVQKAKPSASPSATESKPKKKLSLAEQYEERYKGYEPYSKDMFEEILEDTFVGTITPESRAKLSWLESSNKHRTKIDWDSFKNKNGQSFFELAPPGHKLVYHRDAFHYSTSCDEEEYGYNCSIGSRNYVFEVEEPGLSDYGLFRNAMECYRKDRSVSEHLKVSIVIKVEPGSDRMIMTTYDSDKEGRVVPMDIGFDHSLINPPNCADIDTRSDFEKLRDKRDKK